MEVGKFGCELGMVKPKRPFYATIYSEQNVFQKNI
jgi:hypothetical protein